MTKFAGMGVSPGRIVGPVYRMPPAVVEPSANATWDRAGTTVEAEQARLKDAARAVQTELYARAEATGGDAKILLETTALMAADPVLLQSANAEIVAGVSAERAVWEAGSQVAEMLRGLGGYMAQRTQDVLDVRSRIVAELRGQPAPGVPAPGKPFILAAATLAPTDAAALDPAVVVGILTTSGGPQSHTAVMARSLGIPTVVGAEGTQALQDGVEVYLDGASGVVIVHPGDTERAAVALWARQTTSLGAFNGHGTTSDAHHVSLLANVATAAEAEHAAAANAEGIGLLRTEFCFLNRDTEPSMGEQAAAYEQIFAQFPGRPVIIRTLDASSDQPLPFLNASPEQNPALGTRGYRTGSGGVLERQLEAIAAASKETEADVQVMAPMISTAAEAAGFAQLCERAGLGSAGVMVEVPAAALSAAAIARHVDFLSIGTNDLTQYAMAADRDLGSLGALNDPWQPAVLRLVSLTVQGVRTATENDDARHAPPPISVCGEAAADPALAVVLVGLGVDSLSMSSRSLPAVSAVLKSVDLDTARELADLAVHASDPAEGRRLVRDRLPILQSLGL